MTLTTLKALHGVHCVVDAGLLARKKLLQFTNKERTLSTMWRHDTYILIPELRGSGGAYKGRFFEK
jgi:hypothetical protein